MRRSLATSVLLLAALSGAGCLGGAEDAGTPPHAIRIGAVLPFTGRLSASGSNLEQALLMAAEEVNKSGGIFGRPIALRSKDTRSSAARGLEAARQLIEDEGVVALIGPGDGTLSSLIVPLAASSKTLFMSGDNNVPHFTAEQSGGYFFHIAPSNQTLAAALARRMVSDGVRRASVVAVNDAYGNNFADDITRSLSDLGAAVVARVMFQEGEANFGDTVFDVEESHPDGSVIIGYPTDAAALLAEWSTVGHRRWYLTPPLRNEVFVQNVLPGVLDGAVGIQTALPIDSDVFAAVFAKRWGGELPFPESYAYYDAFCVISLATAMAMSQSGGELRGAEAIRPNIREVATTRVFFDYPWHDLVTGLRTAERGQVVSYRGASGTVQFDENGDTPAGVLRFWHVEGNQIIDDEYIVRR